LALLLHWDQAQHMNGLLGLDHEMYILAQVSLVAHTVDLENVYGQVWVCNAVKGIHKVYFLFENLYLVVLIFFLDRFYL